MNYEILDSDNDLIQWEKTLQVLPDVLQDVYFYPEYIGMHKFINGTRALMFVIRENENIWLHPFLLQPIDAEDYSIDGEPWFDIESAYGYGGPLSNTEDLKFLRNAQKQFSQWCKKNNVVAEFIRFHPLLNNHTWAYQEKDIEYDRNTVSQNLKNFDVDDPPFSGKVRNMIKRVEKAGIVIEAYDPAEKFSSFVELYLETMTRINAGSYYYFNETYFSNLSRLVAENGWLVGAVSDSDWVGAAIFLRGKNVLHYHLSATNPNCRIPGITNALIFKGMKLGKSKGLNLLHLGGGNSSDLNDSLLRFKQKMGDKINKFFIGKQIYNHGIYSQLKHRWESRYPALKEQYNNRLLCYRFVA